MGQYSRTGGDVCLDILDGHIWRTFREYLVLELEYKAMAAELVQSMLVL